MCRMPATPWFIVISPTGEVIYGVFGLDAEFFIASIEQAARAHELTPVAYSQQKGVTIDCRGLRKRSHFTCGRRVHTTVCRVERACCAYSWVVSHKVFVSSDDENC